MPQSSMTPLPPPWVIIGCAVLMGIFLYIVLYDLYYTSQTKRKIQAVPKEKPATSVPVTLPATFRVRRIIYHPHRDGIGLSVRQMVILGLKPGFIVRLTMNGYERDARVWTADGEYAPALASDISLGGRVADYLMAEQNDELRVLQVVRMAAV